MSLRTSPLESIIDCLAEDGYAVIPDFVTAKEVEDMAGELQRLKRDEAFHRAGVGKGQDFTLDGEIRGDYVYWIDEHGEPGAWSNYYAQLEELRRSVNRELMLGLFEFEGHYASYPAGAFYKRHLDRFKDDDRRTLTCILYLNNAWHAEDGGQLRIYLDEHDDAHALDIEPSGGTLVAFLSYRFWHEVLPATRERMSLTGWFKCRG